MKDMGKRWFAAALAAVLVSGQGFAQEGQKKDDAYARVISVVEIKEVRKTPKEVCKDVVVESGSASGDDRKILGTVGGAVVGGVLGHQVGGGRGKDIATAAGAVAGALGGRKIQENQQRKKAQPVVEKRCETVTESIETTVGYDVKYEFDGRQQTVRMSRKPGDRIPMKNGKPVIN